MIPMPLDQSSQAYSRFPEKRAKDLITSLDVYLEACVFFTHHETFVCCLRTASFLSSIQVLDFPFFSNFMVLSLDFSSAICAWLAYREPAFVVCGFMNFCVGCA